MSERDRRKFCEDAIRATGRPCRFEQGKNHIKVYMQDRLVVVLSRGSKSASRTSFREDRNTIRSIRALDRELSS